MRHAVAEARLAGVLLVDVVRIEVARDPGDSLTVLVTRVLIPIGTSSMRFITTKRSRR
jgi:hypothetical protein